VVSVLEPLKPVPCSRFTISDWRLVETQPPPRPDRRHPTAGSRPAGSPASTAPEPTPRRRATHPVRSSTRARHAQPSSNALRPPPNTDRAGHPPQPALADTTGRSNPHPTGRGRTPGRALHSAPENPPPQPETARDQTRHPSTAQRRLFPHAHTSKA